ncbi:unnamed protein product [Peniophora sp. CBMAI 1063]|nr:unnamed protein product [Peniophora sp. CBMAI 1063]
MLALTPQIVNSLQYGCPLVLYLPGSGLHSGWSLGLAPVSGSHSEVLAQPGNRTSLAYVAGCFVPALSRHRGAMTNSKV